MAKLDEHYEHVASKFVETTSGDYAHLVVPTGNSAEPLHRWFHLKEAYSCDLLSRVLKDTELFEQDALDVFEPFAGSGTTAVSLARLIAEGQFTAGRYSGMEANPFLHLLASSKLTVTQGPSSSFMAAAREVVVASEAKVGSNLAVPGLATFSTEHFPGDNLQELASLAQSIEEVDVSELDRGLLQVCLAATVEPSSRLRKDGRALRRVATPRTERPRDWFLAHASRMAADIPDDAVALHGAVECGDIRKFVVPKRSVGRSDLAVFSPPYPNNIDYTEVYKLEAWMLGLISSQEGFRRQRHLSLRSHGSLKWEDRYTFATTPSKVQIERLIAPLIAAIPADRYELARRQLVCGYVDDMFTTLSRVADALRPGGHMVCVVGNSLHGSAESALVIAADLLIATLAQSVGLTVERIEVARVPNRRRTDSRFLRESVIFARKGGDLD
ncbi:hypothetical protein [Aeromicrobium sp.]|uniref:hypothetical protein n=1 Tax=Aeromicrobium sp. TaxID=1871063 RepID=UPI00403412D2